MFNILNAILVIVLVLNIFALGTSRILSVVRIVALQGALLGIIPLLVGERVRIPSMIAASVAIALKGIVIPAIMMRSLRSAQIKREVGPLIGLLASIVLGAAATALALVFSAKFPLVGRLADTLVFPASIATVLIGFIILTTRYKAISQVLGYLVLENGIFIFGTLLVEAIPLVVEMGVLLDLFVGIFVISIITNHINQAFSSLDTRRLVSLKE